MQKEKLAMEKGKIEMEEQNELPKKNCYFKKKKEKTKDYCKKKKKRGNII